jgi:hypothetical protein
MYSLKHVFDVWPLRAAAVCVLALAVVLAQPVASLAWLAGAHATPAQVVFHKEALAHGQAGHHHVDPAHCGACEASVHFDLDVASGPVFGPTPASSAPFPAVLYGVLAGSLDEPPAGGAWRLALPADLPPPQNFPTVPHRPPVRP